MACGAHRVLSVRRGGAGAVLLGLSDDVDCAVVELGVAREGSDASHAAAKQPETASSVPEQPPAEAESPQQDIPHICAIHVASIPALAYVAAGKTQRKALLLAPPGDAWPLGLLRLLIPWGLTHHHCLVVCLC